MIEPIFWVGIVALSLFVFGITINNNQPTQKQSVQANPYLSLTFKQREKFIHKFQNAIPLLEMARNFIKKRHTQYVCVALDYAASDCGSWTLCKRLQSHIRDVQHVETYSSWLFYNGLGHINHRKGRLLWIDSMLRDLRAGYPVV